MNADPVITSTTVDNSLSQAVMRHLTMTRNPADDFEDPSVLEGPLRRCVLYRKARAEPVGRGGRGVETGS
ncbi:hypothetical protein [Streptomyces sp. NPDC055210]